MILKKLSTIALALLLLFGTLAFVVFNQAQSVVIVNLSDRSNLTIGQIIQNNTDFSTLYNWTQTTNLTSVLNGNVSLTVFAPTNTAFEALPNATRQLLMNNTAMMNATLAYHIAPNVILSPDQLRDVSTVTTGLVGNSIKVSFIGGVVRLNNNVTISGTSIVAKNGIINIITAVLTPPTNNTQISFPVSAIEDMTNQFSPFAAGYRNGTSYTRLLNNTLPQVNLQLLAGNFVAPMQVVPAADGSGRLFVVDQIGLIWIVTANGTKLPTPFLNITNKITPLNPGYDERGLLSMAFHPNYTQTGTFYVFYTAPLRQGGPAGWNHTNIIAEFKVSNNSNVVNATSERILMQIDHPYSNHNGGVVLFGPDGYLYITLGDGGNANDVGTGHTPVIGNAQDLTKVLGKTLRIDVSNATQPTPPPTPQVKNFTLYVGEITTNQTGFGTVRTNLTSPGPTLNFTVGDRINMTVTNAGNQTHAWQIRTQPNGTVLFNATIPAGNNTLAANQTASVTFNVNQAGNFTYIDLVSNATGRVVVSQQNQTQTNQTGVKNVMLYASEVLANGVTYGAFGYSPATLMSPGPTLNFAVGDTVNMTVTNIGTLPHAWQLVPSLSNLTTLFNASIAPTTYLQPGETGSVMFNVTQAGNFTYVCPVPGHIQLGMTGTFVVNSNDTDKMGVIFSGSTVIGTRPYRIPASNPFINVNITAGDYAEAPDVSGSVPPEIYSYGHRNPAFASFYVNQTFGNYSLALIVAEAGQVLFEEVDLISPGMNYGWNLREGTHPFNPLNNTMLPTTGRTVGYLNDTLIGPIFEGGRDLGIVVIGGQAYQGTAIPELKGKYVFGYFDIPTATVVTPTPTPNVTATASPTPNATISPSPNATISPSPNATISPSPNATISPSPNATISPSPNATISPSPNATISPSPNATVSPSPTATPRPTTYGNVTILVANTPAGWNQSTAANFTIDNRMWPTQQIRVANAQTVNVTGYIRAIMADLTGELYMLTSGQLGPNRNVTSGAVYKIVSTTPPPTATPTPTGTAPTATATATATATPTGSPQPTASPTPTGTPNATATPTATASPTASPTVTASPTASPTATATPPTGPQVQSADSGGADKTSFAAGESIYIKGSGFPASTACDVYVINGSTTVTNGMSIPATLGGLSSTTTDASGNIPNTQLWSNPPSGSYSVVLDVNRNQVYDQGSDALFTGITVGAAEGGGLTTTTLYIIAIVVIIIIIVTAAAVLYRRRVV